MNRRTRRLVVASVCAVLLGLILVGWLAWTTGWDPAPGRESPRIVRVPRGAGAEATADTLVANGLLQRRRAFVWGARLSGADRKLRAGKYSVPFGLSPRELLRVLVAGRAVPVKVTLPEGLDAASIAGIVARELGCDAERFLVAADSLVAVELIERELTTPTAADAYAVSLQAAASRGDRDFHRCEGYLRPDTYHFAEGTTAAAAAAVIVGQGLDSLAVMLAELVAEPPEGPAASLTPHQLVTLASLVEAEARIESERPLVAAVYWNRLQTGRLLEADPTVAYLLGKRGRRLYYKDLEIDSEWNTYRRRGLPPGPIGNPGAASLRAALHPDPNCDALYFVADGEGGHVFSLTYAEHLRAVDRYRRQRGNRR